MIRTPEQITEDNAIRHAVNELGNAFCAGIMDFIAIVITIVSCICLIIACFAGALIVIKSVFDFVVSNIGITNVYKILIPAVILSIVIWAFIRTNKFIHKQYPG